MKKIKHTPLFSLMLVLCFQSFSQSNLQTYLGSVKENNKTLIAAREITKSAKIEAKTGLTPTNPEFEFGYFPGNTDAIGTKQVLGISQSINFPTQYIHANKLANEKQNIADIEYQKTTMQILFQASIAFNTAIYLNKLSINQQKQLTDAKTLVEFYLKKQKNGDATQLEVNKAKLFLLDIQNKLRLTNSKQKINSELLKKLNGGTYFVIRDTIYNEINQAEWPEIASEIDEILPNLKALESINQQAELQIKLCKAQGLPNLVIGYESEKILGDTYSGIKAGLTIPLWENKNMVKHAKANLLSKQGLQEQIKLNTQSNFYAYYLEAETLKQNLNNFKQSLAEMNNQYLLSRSLELGQISAIEYFMELDYFYGILDDFFELEYQYHISLTELYKYRLN